MVVMMHHSHCMKVETIGVRTKIRLFIAHKSAAKRTRVRSKFESRFLFQKSQLIMIWYV